MPEGQVDIGCDLHILPKSACVHQVGGHRQVLTGMAEQGVLSKFIWKPPDLAVFIESLGTLPTRW
jgi:hypothetical protein